ncbi:UNVERIFIED_ORG: hypothetical protein J2Y84_002845 [Pseudomonas reinekei]
MTSIYTYDIMSFAITPLVSKPTQALMQCRRAAYNSFGFLKLVKRDFCLLD